MTKEDKMLRNICYTLMAGCVITSFWKMQNHIRRYEPTIESHDVIETYESSDAEQMADLLAWVNTIEKSGGLHPDDQTELFDPYIDLEFGTPDIKNQLELGMSREEVRFLLGDPIVDMQDDMLWTYDTARVMFEDNRLQGWVEIDADLTLQAAIHRMQPRDERLNTSIEIWESLHLLPKRIPAKSSIIRSRVAHKRSPRRLVSFGRSVDRMYNSINRTKRKESRMYRKPQYLSNMFPSREQVRRERDSRVNRHNGRVTSYRRNSG